MLIHPNGDTQESEQSQTLVCPCEVTPQDVEAIRAALGPHQDAGHHSEDSGRQSQTLLYAALVNVERLGKCHAQTTQSGVAGSDRQNDDAQQSDDAADGAQDLTADSADSSSCAGGSTDDAQIEDTHCSSGPNHGDEAFHDHHVVESGAALTLALHSAGDDSSLGRMETGQQTAGHSDEEGGEEVLGLEIVGVAEAGLRTVDQLIQQGSLPCGIPNLNQRIALGEHANEYTDCGEQQDSAEDGINTADNGVNGEHGGNQIVSKDCTVNDPGGCRGGSAVKTKDLRCGDITGGVDEHSTDQQKQQAAEHLIHRVHALVAVASDHFRHLGTAVTQTDHTGEVVMGGTGNNIADGDGDESDGSKEDALNGAKDGAGTCNVQQVDKGVLPTREGDKVDAILLGICRRLTVIRFKDFYVQFTVENAAYN